MKFFFLIHRWYVLIFYPKWVMDAKMRIEKASLLRNYNSVFNTWQGPYKERYEKSIEAIRKILKMEDDIHFHTFWKVFQKPCLNKRKLEIEKKYVLRHLISYRLISKK